MQDITPIIEALSSISSSLEKLQSFPHSIMSGIGVFIGIIAGIIIDIAVRKFFINIQKKELTNNIIFEIEYNICHIEEMIADLDSLEIATSMDDPDRYPCYLNVKHKLQSATIRAYRNGHLYKIMNSDHVASLMNYSESLTEATESFYNQKIAQIYNNKISKEESGKIINTIRKVLKDHRDNLEKVYSKLK